MSIYSKLYDWQKKLVDELKDKDSYGLFLDCGLGKTPVSLGFAEVNNCDKILIITINTKAEETGETKWSWLDWASKMNLKYDFKNKKSTEFSPDKNEILLINYESLFKKRKKGEVRKEKVTLQDNVKEFIRSCKGHNVAIIVDESHKMKDTGSLQTCAIMQIKSNLKLFAKEIRCYLLTGTPFTAGYEDLYSQLKMLGCPMTKGAFMEKYCIRGNVYGLHAWQQPVVGYKNVNELFELVHQYAVTIKTKEVLDLPEQTFVNHTSKMSKSFRLFCSEKIKMDVVNQELKLRNLPYRMTENEWLNLSLNDKDKYMKLFDAKLVINNNSQIYVLYNKCIGSPSSTINDIMSNIRFIYDNMNFESEEYQLYFKNLNYFNEIHTSILNESNPKKSVSNPFYRNISYPDNKWVADTITTAHLRARQLSIGFNGNADEYSWYDRTRLNDLEKFLTENKGNNFLLFYNYTPELIEIYNICEKLGYNIDVCSGEVNSMTFYNKYTNMNESQKLTNVNNIILANFASGSTGLNWQEYYQCILFSCPIYRDYEQGIKRLHRDGQKHTVIYHKFYQDNWLDNKMLESLEKKEDYTDQMFEDDLNRVKSPFNSESE